jgi:DNA replication protein DnaC
MYEIFYEMLVHICFFRCVRNNVKNSSYIGYIVHTMKFFETRFDEYVSTCANHNFHPRLKTMIDKFPDQLLSLKNIIIYGSSGVGKYDNTLQ